MFQTETALLGAFPGVAVEVDKDVVSLVCQGGHSRLRWLRVTPTLGQALMGRHPISPISTVRVMLSDRC